MRVLISAFIFSAALFAILAGQDYFGVVNLSAVPSKEETQLKTKYEDIYKKLKVQTFAGKKLEVAKEKAPIKIVNFWASWCKPCIEEFKSLNELKEKFGDKVQILGVNTDDEDQKKKIQKLSKKYDFKFQVVPDKNSELVTKFDVKNIPFSVIYINGKVHQFHEGAMDFMAEEFLEDVQKKLK